MVKSRILWGLWIILTVIFWIFADGYLGIFLPAVSLTLPLFSGLVTKLASKNLEVFIKTGISGEKGQMVSGKITLVNRSLFPLDRIVCTLRCENLLTGEQYRPAVRTAVPGHMRVRREIEFQSRRCGRIRLQLKRVTVYDPFGLFRFQVKIKGETEALTLFRPHTFGLETQISYGENMNLDSDEYSMQKAGFDPSETFAIRDYRPGDRVRQIHWKLSEKLDNLMVRDYGLPIQNTILLLLETGRLPGEAKPEPECLDALAEGILSLSQELVEQQIIHTVGWQNHEEGTYNSREISGQEDLMELMPRLLGAVPGEDPLSVAGHYLESHECCEFAHVVIFTAQRLGDLALIEDQCLVTEIICEQRGGGGYQMEGLRMLTVSPDSIADDLAYLEI